MVSPVLSRSPLQRHGFVTGSLIETNGLWVVSDESGCERATSGDDSGSGDDSAPRVGVTVGCNGLLRASVSALTQRCWCIGPFTTRARRPSCTARDRKSVV